MSSSRSREQKSLTHRKRTLEKVRKELISLYLNRNNMLFSPTPRNPSSTTSSLRETKSNPNFVRDENDDDDFDGETSSDPLLNAGTVLPIWIRELDTTQLHKSVQLDNVAISLQKAAEKDGTEGGFFSSLLKHDDQDKATSAHSPILADATGGYQCEETVYNDATNKIYHLAKNEMDTGGYNFHNSKNKQQQQLSEEERKLLKKKKKEFEKEQKELSLKQRSELHKINLATWCNSLYPQKKDYYQNAIREFSSTSSENNNNNASAFDNFEDFYRNNQNLFTGDNDDTISTSSSQAINAIRTRERRFDVIVEGVNSSGKTFLAQEICRQQPFKDAVAVYLPLHRIVYSKTEINDLSSLLHLALGAVMERVQKEEHVFKREQQERIMSSEIQSRASSVSGSRRRKKRRGGNSSSSDDDSNNSDGNSSEEDDDDEDEPSLSDSPIFDAVSGTEIRFSYRYDEKTSKLARNIVKKLAPSSSSAHHHHHSSNASNASSRASSQQNFFTVEDSDNESSSKAGGDRSSQSQSPSSATNFIYPGNTNQQYDSSPSANSQSSFWRSQSQASSNNNFFGGGEEEDSMSVPIIWVIDDLDAVDRGNEQTLSFLADFVSPLGRQSETVKVIHRLSSSPTRKMDSVLCFGREDRESSSCVFDAEPGVLEIPPRRFVLERWDTEQTCQAIYHQLVSKMRIIYLEQFDQLFSEFFTSSPSSSSAEQKQNRPDPIDYKHLFRLSKIVCSSPDMFFGLEGPFRGNPYMVEVFSEVVALLTVKKLQETFKNNNSSSQNSQNNNNNNNNSSSFSFYCPTFSELSEQLMQFRSPISLVEHFFALRWERMIWKQQYDNENSNNQKSSNQKSKNQNKPSFVKDDLTGMTFKDCLDKAGELSNHMLSNLHHAKSETLLSFTLIDGDKESAWAESLVKCELLHQFRRRDESELSPVQKALRDQMLYNSPKNTHDNKNDNKKSSSSSKTMRRKVPHQNSSNSQLALSSFAGAKRINTYAFRSRVEAEFFAALRFTKKMDRCLITTSASAASSNIFGSSSSSYSKNSNKQQQEETESEKELARNSLPWSPNFRTVWLALASHAAFFELGYTEKATSRPLTTTIINAAAIKFVAAYHRYREEIGGYRNVSTIDDKIRLHQDETNAFLIVELTKILKPSELFAAVEKQLGFHLRMPSFFYWMLDLCGVFGLDETLKFLVEKIKYKTSGKDIPLEFFARTLKNLFTAPVADSTLQKMFQMIQQSVFEIVDKDTVKLKEEVKSKGDARQQQQAAKLTTSSRLEFMDFVNARRKRFECSFLIPEFLKKVDLKNNTTTSSTTINSSSSSPAKNRQRFVRNSASSSSTTKNFTLLYLNQIELHNNSNNNKNKQEEDKNSNNQTLFTLSSRLALMNNATSLFRFNEEEERFIQSISGKNTEGNFLFMDPEYENRKRKLMLLEESERLLKKKEKESATSKTKKKVAFSKEGGDNDNKEEKEKEEENKKDEEEVAERSTDKTSKQLWLEIRQTVLPLTQELVHSKDFTVKRCSDFINRTSSSSSSIGIASKQNETSQQNKKKNTLSSLVGVVSAVVARRGTKKIYNSPPSFK